MEGGAPERRADRRLVQDAVVEQIRACDAQRVLRFVDDYDIICGYVAVMKSPQALHCGSLDIEVLHA